MKSKRPYLERVGEYFYGYDETSSNERAFKAVTGKTS